MVQVEAALQIVQANQATGRQIQRYISFDALRVAGEILEVAAKEKLRSDLERVVPMWFVAIADAHDAQPEVQQCAAAKTVLIAEIRQPSDCVASHRALLRNQRRDAVIRGVIIVEQ